MAREDYICTTCGWIGYPKTRTKGSFGIEVILWLFFLLPGLIYSLWRITSREDVCPGCANPTMIPTTTPRGKELLQKSEPNTTENVSKSGRQSSRKGRSPRRFLLYLAAIVIGIPIFVLIVAFIFR